MPIETEAVLISLKTADYQVLTDFYTRLLGDAQRQKPDKWAFFKLPGVHLVIWADTQTHSPGPLELCLQVANLEATMSQLHELGPCSPIQTASHGRESFLKDPNGNTIILYQPNQPGGTHGTD